MCRRRSSRSQHPGGSFSKMLLRSNFLLFQVASLCWRPLARPFGGSDVRRRPWICDWYYDC
ncbi:hypothetical protein M5D96_010348 [Drosophila gunungcola]|uniref:Uncharacterized protein n=1 Tax=Drosophila gunungcola TaxID=103775 RepID=A0A9P9YHH6_9MUSC|nr:hypothetical protein M5D96_010348 [Drosophila gunungcola]